MSIFDQQRAFEDLQVLVGSRARGRSRAAVRIEDIAALVELAPKLKSAKAEGEVVSAAEYNALVSDVAALHGVLLSIASALQERIRP